jgi:hypothetical protein
MERACTKCGKAIGEKDTRVEFSVQRTIFIVFDESVQFLDGIDDKCVMMLCTDCAKDITSVTIPISEAVTGLKTLEDYKKSPCCNLP